MHGHIAESPALIRQTNEPCRQTFAAQGRSYREHHWIAPMRLTAVQLGPWLRPASYSPSQKKLATRQSHRTTYTPEKVTNKTKTNSSSKTHHRLRRRETKEERQGKGALQGRRDSLNLSHLSKPSSFLAKHTTSENKSNKTHQRIPSKRAELQTSLA